MVPRIYTQVFSQTALWAGKFSKIFARCARRQIFNQIFENIDLPQPMSIGIPVENAKNDRSVRGRFVFL